MRPTRSLLVLAALCTLAACNDDAVAPTAAPTAGLRSTAEGYATRGETRTGWIRGGNGEVMKITFEVQHGRAVWEGDIDLGPVESIATSPEQLRGGDNHGVIIDGSTRRWPGGVVPYVIASNLPSTSRVTNAIAHIEANTGIVDFVPRTNQSAYVIIRPGSGCSSSVGRTGSVQYVNLADGCSTGNTIHELLHALGMFHEQTRCDRDGFVAIHLENVTSGYEGNFTKQCTNATDVSSYAEGSIMHYGATAFSKNGLPTIVSLRGLDSQMGQRSGMNSTDISTVNYMYP